MQNYRLQLAYQMQTIQTQVLCRFAPRRFAPPPLQRGAGGIPKTRFAPCIHRDSEAPLRAMY